MHICAITCLCAVPYMHMFLRYLGVYVHMTFYSFCFHYRCMRQILHCITIGKVRYHYGMVNFLQNCCKRHVRCEMSFVGSNPVLISASASVVTHICFIGPRCNGTPL